MSILSLDSKFPERMSEKQEIAQKNTGERDPSIPLQNGEELMSRDKPWTLRGHGRVEYPPQKKSLREK